jgi:molybdate transport system substrate-binding protein
MFGWNSRSRVTCAAGALVGALALLASGCSDSRDVVERRVVRVAVAANFARTAAELEPLFEARHPDLDLATSVGSTGAFYAQIVNGAPFDVLLAADSERPRKLLEEGRASRVQPYAVGRLALTGTALGDTNTPSHAALAALLGSDSVESVAIANPDTAPYGVAAAQVLRALGVYEKIEPRLALGIDVGQAHQFAVSGAADLAFVALSQALAETALPHVAVPSELHAPVAQDAALLTDNEGALAFLDFLGAAEAARVLEANGYALPDVP